MLYLNTNVCLGVCKFTRETTAEICSPSLFLFERMSKRVMETARETVATTEPNVNEHTLKRRRVQCAPRASDMTVLKFW